MLAALLCNQPLTVVHGGGYENVLWGVPKPIPGDVEAVRRVYRKVRAKAKPEQVEELAEALAPYVERRSPVRRDLTASLQSVELPPSPDIEFDAVARDEATLTLIWELYLVLVAVEARRDDDEAILVLLLSGV